MFKHLLVPLDGSELAEAALPMAKAIAVCFDSEITLLRTVHIAQYLGDNLDFTHVYTNLGEDMKSEAASYLEAKQQALQAAGFNVNCRIIVGESPADAILHSADELGVNAIVMSTHGRGGVMRWVFGSVADKVLRQARVPILLARSSAGEDESYPIAAVASKVGASE